MEEGIHWNVSKVAVIIEWIATFPCRRSIAFHLYYLISNPAIVCSLYRQRMDVIKLALVLFVKLLVFVFKILFCYLEAWDEGAS